MWLAALVVLLIVVYVTAPADWIPHNWRVGVYNTFGAAGYQPAPTSVDYPLPETEALCPPDTLGWRKAQTIEGVDIAAAAGCVADNPYLIAAATQGTNHVSQSTLLKSGLTPDAVVLGRDLDGDGDPDEIEIHLEIAELNGNSPDVPVPITTFDIAPGIQPGLWVFAPKSVGMSTENFDTRKANPLLRAPAPVIRVEQGDKVTVVLENSHYLPHTIHFHGVDHPFAIDHGMPHDETMKHDEAHADNPLELGTDGVAETSEMPAMPGRPLTYKFSPRVAGTMFYHCHVQANVHILMGMQGMFVIEENRPNNWLQTLNIGAGQVRHSSVAVREKYDREYDLHYQDVYKKLADTIQNHTDPRLTLADQHRRWNITQDRANYFLLNGRSFPYTLQESLVVVRPNEKVKLRVLNGGSEEVAMHPHGFRLEVTHLDGIPLKPGNEYIRDVVALAPAQRLDLVLNTTNDGLHNYGEGVWLFHDHREVAQTTDGIYPGGSISAIAFESYLGADGFPKVHGTDWRKFFTAEYYRKEVPIWLDYDPRQLFSAVSTPVAAVVRLVVFGVALAGLLLLLLMPLRRRRQRP
ncbi:MAG: multicopper oxidase domain-containing protein [Porticoccaceae bacterium]